MKQTHRRIETPAIAGWPDCLRVDARSSTSCWRGGTPSPELVARARADVSEASFAQERMWILDRLMPGSQLYNETTLITFGRNVSPDVIEEEPERNRPTARRTAHHFPADQRSLDAGHCARAHDSTTRDRPGRIVAGRGIARTRAHGEGTAGGCSTWRAVR